MGGAINRATVSLRIFGRDLNPVEITQLLACHPSEAHRAGEVVTTTGGKSRIVQTGSWLLNMNEPIAADIADQIAFLLNQTTADLAVWHHITTHYQVDIFCGLFLDGWNRGFTLRPPLLQQLSDRNLTIGVDIYAPVDMWDGTVEE